MAPNESLLVVVDQFEELFRFARVAASEQYRYEAAAFVKLLLEAARQREQNVYVVLTMRSDFLGDCSIFWDLPEAINEGQYLIPRMTRDQRAEAITGPVAVCGGRIEQRLVNRLLNDMGDNPDLLPILQHALMRTWENWAADHAEGEAVDLRHYEAVGTMSDALSRHADEAFNELRDERSRQIAERVFKALTEKGEDNREVRRPTVLRDLCALTGATLGEVVPVLEVFRREGRSFLMPPAALPLDEDSLIDISHESLIRNWERLKGWVDEESQSAQIYTRLAETAVLHERGQAGLWRDPDLQLALDWRERTKPTAAWGQRYHPSFDTAMSFLDASVNARDDAALEEERRRRREIRRTRVAAAIFFLLFMLSLAALTYANVKRNEAQEKSDAAEAALVRAEQANARAESALAEAVRERDRANEQTDAARRSEEVAQTAKDEALKEKKAAEEAKADAVKSAEVARVNARKAEESRAEAETQKVEAETQRAEAEKQKSFAEAETTKSRQLLYASDMMLAQQAYDASNVTLARQLLGSHTPGDGERQSFEWAYLSHLLNREKGSLSYFNNFSTLALTPDGKTLAVGKGDTVVLWDMTANKYLGSAPTGARAVGAMALSPDGRRVALSGVGTNVVTLADTSSPGKGGTLGDGKAEVTSLAFTPDGALLVVGYADDRAELWDVDTRQMKRRFDIDSSVSSLALSPRGDEVAIGTVKGSLFRWGLASPKSTCAADLMADGNSINAVVFSPEGHSIIAATKDGTIKSLVLAANSKMCTEMGGLSGRKSSANAIAFSPDLRRMLAVGYEDNSVEVWHNYGRKRPDGSRDMFGSQTASITLNGHVDAINSVFFLPGGQLLSGSNEGSIKLWDIASLLLEDAPLEEHTRRVNAVAFSPDGRTLATGGNDKAVLLWDVETHKRLDAPALKYKGPVNSIAFSPAGGAIAVGADGLPPSVWDTGVAGAQPRTLTGTSTTSHVRAVAYSPDGKFIVAADNEGSDHALGLWNAETGALIKDEADAFYMRAILSLAVSRDGKLIAVGLGDGSVEVWDIALTKMLSQVSADAGGSRSPVYSVAFSPDGSTLAAGFGGGEVKLLDPFKGVEMAKRRGHKGEVFAVAFSPDGRTLATGGNDWTIKLWATDSFKELITLGGHEDAVMSLAFSPDGKTLASASADRTVRLWHTSKFEPRAAAAAGR